MIQEVGKEVITRHEAVMKYPNKWLVIKTVKKVPYEHYMDIINVLFIADTRKEVYSIPLLKNYSERLAVMPGDGAGGVRVGRYGKEV